MFKVVPLRLGVDEAGTAGFATLIGLPAKTGLALAIIRKARMLFWAAAGGVLLVREGFTPGRRKSPRIRRKRLKHAALRACSMQPCARTSHSANRRRLTRRIG